MDLPEAGMCLHPSIHHSGPSQTKHSGILPVIEKHPPKYQYPDPRPQFRMESPAAVSAVNRIHTAHYRKFRQWYKKQGTLNPHPAGWREVLNMGRYHTHPHCNYLGGTSDMFLHFHHLQCQPFRRKTIRTVEHGLYNFREFLHSSRLETDHLLHWYKPVNLQEHHQSQGCQIQYNLPLSSRYDLYRPSE